MSKNPSREFWMRRGALLCWAVFRYNGNGTMRVTCVETQHRAYDLAAVQRRDAAQLYLELKAKGFALVKLAEVQAAGMSPLALLQRVTAIAGDRVHRNPMRRPQVVRAYTVEVVRRHSLGLTRE